MKIISRTLKVSRSVVLLTLAVTLIAAFTAIHIAKISAAATVVSAQIGAFGDEFEEGSFQQQFAADGVRVVHGR